MRTSKWLRACSRRRRAVKSEYEIDCMRRAGAVAYKGVQAAAKFARPGVLEAEIVGEDRRRVPRRWFGILPALYDG